MNLWETPRGSSFGRGRGWLHWGGKRLSMWSHRAGSSPMLRAADVPCWPERQTVPAAGYPQHTSLCCLGTGRAEVQRAGSSCWQPPPKTREGLQSMCSRQLRSRPDLQISSTLGAGSQVVEQHWWSLRTWFHQVLHTGDTQSRGKCHLAKSWQRGSEPLPLPQAWGLCF